MSRKSGALCVLMAASLWGLLGVFVRALNAAGFGSMQIVAIRAIGSVAILFIVIVCTKPDSFQIRLRDFWVFLGTGIGSMVFFNFCYFKCIEQTSLAIAATLLYTAPVFVAVLARVFLGEKLQKRQYLAIGAAIIGCMMVAGLFSQTLNVHMSGILFGLGSGLGYALYSIFGKKAIQKGYSDVTITFYTFVVTAVVTVWSFAGLELEVRAVTAGTFVSVGCLCVFSTVLAYLFYTKGLQQIPAGYAVVIACIEPVVATVISCVLFHEPITFEMGIGILLVLASSVFM